MVLAGRPQKQQMNLLVLAPCHLKIDPDYCYKRFNPPQRLALLRHDMRQSCVCHFRFCFRGFRNWLETRSCLSQSRGCGRDR